MIANAWHELDKQLLAGLAHSLGTRISTVASVAQFLQSGDMDPIPLGHLLEGESEKLETVLAGMRMLASSGRPDVRSITVHELCVEVASLLRHHHRFRDDVFLALDVEGTPPVSTDVDALRRCLLVAVAAMGVEERQVSIRGQADGTHVLISLASSAPNAIERLDAVFVDITAMASAASIDALRSTGPHALVLRINVMSLTG